MKKFGLAGCLGLLVLLVIIMVLVGVSTYNRLVKLDEAVKTQWSNVENVYQRRVDLIPNLVRTVQGAADFERGTLQAVIEARARATQVSMPTPDDPQAFAQFEAAQNALSGALSRLLVVVERYPELKANQNFLDLQSQLEGTENRITVERMRFNEVAQQFNTALRRFPTVLFAGLLGFKQRPYFQATPGAERPPDVNFNFGTQTTT